MNVKNKRDNIYSIFYGFDVYLLAVAVLAVRLARRLAILAARLTVLTVLAVLTILTSTLAARLTILAIATTARHTGLRRDNGGGVIVVGGGGGGGVRIDSSAIRSEYSTVRSDNGIRGGVHSRIRGLVILLVARNHGGGVLDGSLGAIQGTRNRVHFLLLNTLKILRRAHL